MGCSMWAFLSFMISCSLLRLMSIELVMPSKLLIFCHPILFLLSVFPSIRVFSNEPALCIRWPMCWRTSLLPMIIQGWFSLGLNTLISLPPKELSNIFMRTTNSKVLVRQFSAYFMVQLSHPYMTTGKNVALTRWTFVGKKKVSMF